MVRKILIVFAAMIPFAAQPQSDDEFNPTEDNFCGLTHIRVGDLIKGEWALTQNAGFARVAGMHIPLGPVDPENVDIFHGNTGNIIVSNENFTDRMVMSPATGTLEGLQGSSPAEGGIEDWAPGLDLEVQAGCAWSELPRFAGTTNYNLDGAGNMQMLMVVHFANIAHGFGVVQFRGRSNDGHDFFAMRSVFLGRGF